jgi:hypothetical protein
MHPLNPYDGPLIRKLANAATPGPWDVDTDSPAIWTLGETVAGGTVAWINTDQQTGDHHPHGDAQLIAFFDPQVAHQVANMLDRLKDIIELASHTDDIVTGAEVASAVLCLAQGFNPDGTDREDEHPSALADTVDTKLIALDVSPRAHTAHVEPHFTDAEDTIPYAKVVCPECQTEWGWRMVARGTDGMAQLEALAEQHNADSLI